MVVCKLYAVLVGGGVLPHVVCGCRVLDRREEEGETLQTLSVTFGAELLLVEPTTTTTTKKNHPIAEKHLTFELPNKFCRD